jgi:thymidine phosphorylase
VRSEAAAWKLIRMLEAVGERLGLVVRAFATDGRQPIGCGIGPALEAWDVLRVLRNESSAPADLRERSVFLASQVLELSGRVEPHGGALLGTSILEDGRAWRKFAAICEAQGGLREPPRAELTEPVPAPASGVVTTIDNRRLARVAKLAGAPSARAAGVLLEARMGDRVTAGQPLFTVHAETPGELAYALEYVAAHDPIFTIVDGEHA